MGSQRTSEILNAVYGISVIKRATGNAALAQTLAPGARFLLKEVRIHLSATGGAGNLTIKLNSGVNAVYDTTLLTQDMTAIQDLIYQPQRPLEFEAIDEIDIAWANANSRVYGIEILYNLI